MIQSYSQFVWECNRQGIHDDQLIRQMWEEQQGGGADKEGMVLDWGTRCSEIARDPEFNRIVKLEKNKLPKDLKGKIKFLFGMDDTKKKKNIFAKGEEDIVERIARDQYEREHP